MPHLSRPCHDTHILYVLQSRMKSGTPGMFHYDKDGAAARALEITPVY